MSDIAPALLESIQTDVIQGIEKSAKVKSVLALIESGKATHKDSLLYARELGEILAGAFKVHLSSAVLPDGKMYYNIAKRILDPTLKTNHDIISGVAEQVQTILNEQAGIGLKAIRPALEKSRIDGFIERLTSEPLFDDVAWILQEPIVAFSEHVVDEVVRANVDFQGESGLSVKVSRTVDSDPCKWCREIAGEYTFPNIPDDVYRRHDRCHCIVTYNSKRIHSGGDKRIYTRGKVSGKYQLTQEERIRRLKEREKTAEERAKAARQKRIETWAKKRGEI